MSTVTITQLALDLHTDLTNIKAYGDKAPAVTLALIAEAEAKLAVFREYLEGVHRGLFAAEASAQAA